MPQIVWENHLILANKSGQCQGISSGQFCTNPAGMPERILSEGAGASDKLPLDVAVGSHGRCNKNFYKYAFRLQENPLFEYHNTPYII